MSELRIVTPEDVDATDPLSLSEKHSIVDRINSGLVARKSSYQMSPTEAEFARALVAKSGWDAEVEASEKFISGARLVIKRMSKASA